MDIPTEAELLVKVRAFLERHDMAPTRFGREATGEPQLIDSIERGRSPSLKTAQRIAAFMAEKDAELELARRTDAARGVEPASRKAAA